MAALDNTQVWTYDRMVAELPAESRYELHDGVLLDMSPSPNGDHQDIALNFAEHFRVYFRVHKTGKAFIAPLDVIFSPKEVVQPDVLVLLGDPNRRVRGRVEVVPDLVVEIISPSTFYRDTIEKSNIYAQKGVKEYWLIDPANRVVEVFTLRDNTYALHQEMSEPGILTSPLLPGFEISYDEVFAT